MWIVEYGKPRGLARAVESGIEMIAGTPSIVFAIFGLTFFSQGIFEILSFKDAGGSVFGRSFLISGFMMSFIALPLIFSTTREALLSIPAHIREASFALGNRTIFFVCLALTTAGIFTLRFGSTVDRANR